MNRFRAIVSAQLTTLVLLSASPSTAEPIARLQASATAIEWLPAIEGSAWTLSVAGPEGMVETHEFPVGAVPKLSLFDQAGQPLADGSYTWELCSIPRQPRRGAKGQVESGSFRILGGEVLAGGQSEPPERRFMTKDQTVPDDLIVDGKGCIGLGCAPGEDFFGEALRLKQSVVRLRFEDTSGAAGFPARDWQLTVNDSGSGGADKLSIEDLTAGTVPFTVRGGAPTDSLYVTDTGRIGLGTAVPATRLDIRGNTADSVLRLHNTSPAGLAGVHFVDNNGVADTFFGIRNAAPSETWLLSAGRPFVFLMGGFERMRIQGDGNVGIGCKNPGFKLVINAGAGAPCTQEPFSAINAGASNFTTSSSRTIKENLQAVKVPDLLAKMADIGVYTFDFINGPKDFMGLIAEDFHRIFGRGSDQLLNGQEVEMALWLAVRELTARSDEQKQLIDQQQSIIRRLEERMARLEEKQ